MMFLVWLIDGSRRTNDGFRVPHFGSYYREVLRGKKI